MLIRRVAVPGLCIAILSGTPVLRAQDAPPQSLSDLKQEIERLRQEVAQRDAELTATRERIARLEKELADLKAGAAAASPASPDPQPPAAPPPPTPADPALGPGGMLAALQARYLDDFPTMPDTSTQQRLNLHLRALEGWCARTNRDSIKQFAWPGRIDPASLVTNGRTCSLSAVFKDPSREFRVPVTVDQTALGKVRGVDGTVLKGDVVFNVVVKPRLRVNPDRPAPEAFQQPPMLAPYVEYVLELDVRSVVPAPTQP